LQISTTELEISRLTAITHKSPTYRGAFWRRRLRAGWTCWTWCRRKTNLSSICYFCTAANKHVKWPTLHCSFVTTL